MPASFGYTNDRNLPDPQESINTLGEVSSTQEVKAANDSSE